MLIVYPPGGYGSFLHWCLMYFSGEIGIESDPFFPSGSAHNFVGTQLDCTHNRSTSLSTVQYLNSSDVSKFARSHGFFDNDHAKDINRPNSYISQYQKYFEKIILITQDHQSSLMLLHNCCTKIIGNSYQNQIDEIIEKYKNAFGSVDPVPVWQIREMISYYYDSYLCYVNDLYQPVNDNDVINLSVRDLIDNFEPTLKMLFDQLGLQMVREDTIDTVKTKWLSMQKFIGIDHTCQQIVQSVIDGQALDWDDLSIFDEAWIQWQLRNNKFEIRCFGLDKFPTNSIQLKELLHHV